MFLFYNAAKNIFFLLVFIEKYFEYSPEIYFMCTSKQFLYMLCILKALCILLKVYTEPYWRKTDDVENAATIGSVYRRMFA